ncbi:MAG: type IV toxin-antitoxin system AbiEi family antitoxin domain-containing protein [Ilumatobacteraceae bacterium]
MTKDVLTLARQRAADRRGIVTVRQLTSEGASRREVYRLVERNEFTIVMPGVLASTHHPHDREQLMVAACAADAGVSISLTTAAREWAFRRMRDDADVHALVDHGCRLSLPGVIVHQCRDIDQSDIVHRSDGVRLTNPARTWFDCADLMGSRVATTNLEYLLDSGKGTMTTYARVVARLGSPRRPGSRMARLVLASRDEWSHLLQSELERMVLDEIRKQGLPEPERQFVVQISGFGTVRFDFAWPELMVALEVDHWFWHAGREPSRRDNQRDLAATAIGWRVVRVEDLDVAEGLPMAIRRLTNVLTIARAA